MAPIEEYKRLWIEVFGDDEEFVSDVFAIGQPILITEENILISACLLIPYSIDFGQGKSYMAGYVYGVLTAPAFRGQGYAKRLLDKAHAHARSEGLAYCFLIAADDHLRQYYIRQGYSDILPSATSYPVLRHSQADRLLLEKYHDPMVQEPVQFYSLTALPIPTEIKALGLLSH